MNSVAGEKRAASNSSLRMCRRCRNEILPKQFGSTLRADVLRAPADGMVTKSDPRGSRIKAKKEAKRELKRIVRTEGIVAAARFHLNTPMADVPNPECEDCLTLQRGTPRRAQFLGYDPKTHSAFVREMRPVAGGYSDALTFAANSLGRASRS